MDKTRLAEKQKNKVGKTKLIRKRTLTRKQNESNKKLREHETKQKRKKHNR